MAKRKHVRDLAPFASSEDLSDERESPLDDLKQKQKLENITEEMKTPTKTKLSVTNVTPRIDISRASSSSHQEDSSPERELFAGKGKETKLEVAFGEEIASDLHSSTEELSFHEGDYDNNKNKRKKSSQGLCDLQPEHFRKDSACSDIGLLSISGRTSRVSSVGSVASAGSGISAYSGISHCSHLSAVSNLSRGSSPHRVSVETSFCGPKPVHTASLDVDDAAKCIKLSDTLREKTEEVTDEKKTVNEEKKRTHRSRISTMPLKNMGINSQTSSSRKDQQHHSKHKRKKPPIENPKTQKFVSLHSDEEEEPIASRSVNAKPKPATEAALDTRTQIYIPLKGTGSFEKDDKECEPNPNSPKRLKPFTNATILNFIRKYDPDKDYASAVRGGRRAKSATEAEYQSKQEIRKEFQEFISMKDDDDRTNGQVKHVRSASAINTMSRLAPDFEIQPAKSKSVERTCSSTQITVPIQVHHTASSPVEPKTEDAACSRQDLPKYLMTNDGTTQYIPLRGSYTELQTNSSNKHGNHLTVLKTDLKSRSDDHNLSGLGSSLSPNLNRHCLPSSLELSYRDKSSRSTKSMTQLQTADHSRTPSPNASMHKNYGTTNANESNHQNHFYRRCSESAKEINSIGRSKSRSGSFRSLFSTIFKRSGSAKQRKGSKVDGPEVSCASASSDSHSRPQQPKKTEPESIIIPLHSPSEEKNSSNLTKKSDKDDAMNSTRTQSHKNNSNINGTNDPTVTTSSAIKVEYSEQQTSNDDKKAQEVDLKSCNIKNDEQNSSIVIGRGRATTKIIELKPSRVQCQVTVHQEGRHPDEFQNDLKKLEKSRPACSGIILSRVDDDEPFYISDDENDSIEQPFETACQLEEESDEIYLSRIIWDNPTDYDPYHLEERKKLVEQEESFEELPYVPTTLPQERSVALPIVPIKERTTEMKTCPVDRPHSATALNSSLLETYATIQPVILATKSISNEKLHITLPRTDVSTENPARKYSNNPSVSPSNVGKRHHSISTYNAESAPPPLPPRKTSMSWIAFDDGSLEVRQSPKRITTLPRSYAIDGPHPDNCTYSDSKQKYVFVNADECSCDCHDTQSNTPTRKTLQKPKDSPK